MSRSGEGKCHSCGTRPLDSVGIVHILSTEETNILLSLYIDKVTNTGSPTKQGTGTPAFTPWWGGNSAEEQEVVGKDCQDKYEHVLELSQTCIETVVVRNQLIQEI